MIIGIPKEIRARPAREYRVAMVPVGVQELVHAGASCFVETGAGDAAGYTDEDYRRAGAQIAYAHDEVFRRADILLKVDRPTLDEISYMKRGQLLMAFLQLPLVETDYVRQLVARDATAIGYEMITDNQGAYPILRAMSRIAGTMAFQIAARLLEAGSGGGRGILINGAVGIPPAEVVIIGAGSLGSMAAEVFNRAGASVHVFDRDLRRLEHLQLRLHHRGVTAAYSQAALARAVAFADILITAIHVPGARTPVIVTEAMVKTMKPGAVIIDFAIDHGGAVATSRPMSGIEDVYRVHDVIHFAVPNVPAWVPRTSSTALANEILPMVEELAVRGPASTLRRRPDLATGVYLYRGQAVNPHLTSLSLDIADLTTLLESDNELD